MTPHAIFTHDALCVNCFQMIRVMIEYMNEGMHTSFPILTCPRCGTQPRYDTHSDCETKHDMFGFSAMFSDTEMLRDMMTKPLLRDKMARHVCGLSGVVRFRQYHHDRVWRVHCSVTTEESPPVYTAGWWVTYGGMPSRDGRTIVRAARRFDTLEEAHAFTNTLTRPGWWLFDGNHVTFNHGDPTKILIEWDPKDGIHRARVSRVVAGAI
jgi:hypothetical protein